MTGAFPANRGDFNPRSSCEERRGRLVKWHRRGRYFNPRSSCEERRLSSLVLCRDADISIHAPHARSDLPTICELIGKDKFQSTLLMRGATIPGGIPVRRTCSFQSTLLMRGATKVHSGRCIRRLISIHAPHARSDKRDGGRVFGAQDFNPRSSCEERLRQVGTFQQFA